MSNAMLANASAADAYVDFDLGGQQDDIWYTFDVLFPAAALAYWQDFFTFLCQLLDVDEDTELDQVYIDDNGWEWGGGTSLTPAQTADVWHTVELRHEVDGTSTLYIDGALVGSGGGSSGGIFYLRLGLGGGDPDASLLVYYRNVKAGTARGGTDLFADDFSSGDLSAWTSAVGNVTVVTDPLPSVPSLRRKRFSLGEQTQGLTVRVAQSGSSAKTELHLLELNVRPLDPGGGQ